MGLREIAARLGISKSYARRLAEGRTFPEGQRLNQGWVWSAEDVEAWIAKHRPQQADPG
jgi:predicted DNA-binding transcriptional regulator AlpA